MSITRREFVKSSAGLAGILAAGAAPSLYAAGANDRIRVACVGYSDRFRYSLLPCFKHHCKKLNFDLVAVADLWRKRLTESAVPGIQKSIGHAVAAYRSDVELYEKAKDVDAVIMSTADFQHAQHQGQQHRAVHGLKAEIGVHQEETQHHQRQIQRHGDHRDIQGNKIAQHHSQGGHTAHGNMAGEHKEVHRNGHHRSSQGDADIFFQDVSQLHGKTSYSQNAAPIIHDAREKVQAFPKKQAAQAACFLKLILPG
jgi:hypothetical protein